MNRSLSILSVLALVAAAGCAAPPEAEEEVATSGDSALSSMVDEPAEVPEGAKPKVEAVDLSTVKFDLADFQNAQGKLDLSRLKIDVLDTGRPDHDYAARDRELNLKWVESDRSSHPFEGFGSADVGGGKCRIKSLSLKKIVVGCKWTW